MVTSLCPTCGGPMSPLFTGSFCPKDCDRPASKASPSVGGTAQFDLAGSRWELMKLPRGKGRTVPPGDWDRGWWLRDNGSPAEPTEDDSLSPTELAHVWAKSDSDAPGWSGFGQGDLNSGESPITIFRRVP